MIAKVTKWALAACPDHLYDYNFDIPMPVSEGHRYAFRLGAFTSITPYPYSRLYANPAWIWVSASCKFCIEQNKIVCLQR
jgi:hypothetical protein